MIGKPMAYKADDIQSTDGEKSDPGYAYIRKNMEKYTAAPNARAEGEDLDGVMSLDEDTEATVDTRDYNHGSAKLPKSLRKKR